MRLSQFFKIWVADIESNPREDAISISTSNTFVSFSSPLDHRAEQMPVGVLLTSADRPEDVDGIAAAIDKQVEDSPAPTKSESERI